MDFDRLTEIQQLALLTPHLAAGLQKEASFRNLSFSGVAQLPVFGICFQMYWQLIVQVAQQLGQLRGRWGLTVSMWALLWWRLPLGCHVPLETGSH